MKRLLALVALLAVSPLFAQSASVNLSELSHSLGAGGIVPLTNGGTGATTETQALLNLLPNLVASECLAVNSAGNAVGWAACGSMVYPGAGLAVSTGSAWGSSITPGTGVATALSVNVGSSGAFVVNGGALGTPSSGTAANLTGLPISGLSGLGSGMPTFLSYSWPTPVTNDVLGWNGSAFAWVANGGGSMVYPSAGIPNSTGLAWGTSYTTTGSGTTVVLATGAVLSAPALGNSDPIYFQNSSGAPDTKFEEAVNGDFDLILGSANEFGMFDSASTLLFDYNLAGDGYFAFLKPVYLGNTPSGTQVSFLGLTSGNEVVQGTPAAVQSALVAANAQTYSPTLASGATNDWDPSGGAGIATVGFAYTAPNSSGSTVDGVLAGSDKQQFMLCNSAALGTNGSYIILENQSSSDSTAANRLMMAGNQALGPQMCVMFTYVAGSIDRWLVGRVMDSGTPPTLPLASGASMTPDCSFKIVTETASQSAFTVNAPTDCTPQNGQYLELDVVNYSTANAYTWNAAYVSNSTVSLPSAGSAASKLDRFAFAWDAANSTWDLKAYALGR